MQILALIAILIAPFEAAANDDAQGILEKLERNLVHEDESATVRIVVSDARGERIERGLEFLRKGKGQSRKVLLRFQSPARLRGVSLLATGAGDQVSRWLYSPAGNQSRRALSVERDAVLAEAGIRPEDLSPQSGFRFNGKVVRHEEWRGRKFSVVDMEVEAGSTYAKILWWIDLEVFLVGKAEYYDKKLNLVKAATFAGYKQFGTGLWHAQKVEFTNKQNNQSVVIEFSGIKVNQSIPDTEFSESAVMMGN